MIKVTIMVPNYNQASLIKRALDSVPRRKDLELLIIDDCSTDSSVQVIEEWLLEHSKEFGHTQLEVNSENRGCGFGKN